MTTPIDTHLEAALRNLTEATSDKPRLWRKALKRAPLDKRRKRRFAWIATFTQSPLASAAMLLVGVGAIVGIGAVGGSIAQDDSYSGPNRAVRRRLTGGFAAAAHQIHPTHQDTWDLIRRSGRTPSAFICPSSTNDLPESQALVNSMVGLDSLGYDASAKLDESIYARWADSESATSVRNQINNLSVSPDAFRYDEGAYIPSTASLAGIGHAMYINGSGNADTNPTDESTLASPGTTAADRQVIRRATMEIKTHDVRAAFLKAQHILKTDRGEYVEQSGMHGEGKDASAELTIRVAADRLSEFLNDLRKLGDVQSEVLTGDDVTMQIVDLEARLRTEKRVETEVLELLESRKDADLNELLKLRQSLAQIRTRIEEMTGRREQYRRLVSLATVLLIIRSGEAATPEPASHWAAFTEAMSEAWNIGVDYLGRVVAWIVRILIGGLIFWIALAGVILYARRCLRKRDA